MSSSSQPQTRTPQNIPALFPLSGNLEDIEVVADIARKMIDHPRLGLAVEPLNTEEKILLGQFRELPRSVAVLRP